MYKTQSRNKRNTRSNDVINESAVTAVMDRYASRKMKEDADRILLSSLVKKFTKEEIEQYMKGEK